MFKDVFEVFIVFTRDCNLNCKYCYETKYNKKMSVKTLNKIINFIKTHEKICRVNLFGGEPFLECSSINYLVDELINIKKTTGRNFIILSNTNGTIYSKEVSDLLNKMSENFTYYHVVSIDGNKKYHDKYRVNKNNEPTYDLVINNINKIKLDCPKVKFGYNSVITPELVDDFYYIAKDFLRNKTFLGGVFQYAEYLTDKKTNYVQSDFEKIYSSILKLNEEGYSLEFLKDRFDTLINTIDYRYNNFLKDHDYCIHNDNVVTIDFDGKVYPCTRYLELEYGELQKYSIYDFMSDEYKGFKNIFNKIESLSDEEEKCDNCQARNSCCICSANIDIHGLDGFKKECSKNFIKYQAMKNINFILS